MGRLWMASLGGETRYEEDLPGCCRRDAASAESSFDCLACGASWQAPLPVEPEECAFTERASDRERKGGRVVAGKREALRPDTTLAPATRPEDEVYVRGLPACCLHSLKEAVVERGERRLLELRCASCGSAWQVTSSLDGRVLERFVTHGGPRVGGKYPAA